MTFDVFLFSITDDEYWEKNKSKFILFGFFSCMIFLFAI